MSVRILQDILKRSPKPSIDEMLEYEVWELHEAIFMLSDWPEYITKNQFEFIAKIKNIPRTFVYEVSPSPNDPEPLLWEFNPYEWDMII